MVVQNLKFLENEFNVIEKIGQGGMGTVFKAKQISMDRIVAIKWLHADFCRNKVFIERFKREARITGKFCHPNSVQVFDIGENEGNHYYIMEYVEGVNLKEKLFVESRFDQKYVIKIMKQILSVLKDAEKMGIIHRDIKPENILITKEDIVKVADLGLAREVEDDASLTQHNIAIGTPQYMSPEQAQGKPIDTRSDQYSLGVTAFHMLTGRVPFQGKTTMEVLLKQVKEPMIKPSTLIKEISPLMDKVIMRMTEKKPALRYQTIDEINSDLDKVLLFLNQKRTTKRKKVISTSNVKNNPNSSKKPVGTSWVPLVVAFLLICSGVIFLYLSPAKAQSTTNHATDPLTIANKLLAENRMEESVAFLKKSLVKMTPKEQVSVIQKINEVEKKIVEVSSGKVMSQAFNSLKDSENGIEELKIIIEKYSSNAELARKNKSTLEERVSIIKAEELKLLNQSKAKAEEESLNKLSLEINSLLSTQNFKQANELISTFQDKHNLNEEKTQLLKSSIKDHEKSFAQEAFKKSEELTQNGEYDKSNQYLNSIKNNFFEKDFIESLETQIKKNEQLKKNLELEIAKKNQQMALQSKEAIFAMLKIAEFKPAKSKLELFKANNLTLESYEFLAKVIASYEEIYVKMEKDLANDYKCQLNLKQLGNRNIDVEINSVTGGIIQYKFMDSKLELTPINEDWAQVYTSIAAKTTKINKSCRLLKLSHFAYANGDLEGAYQFWKEAENLGLNTKDQPKYFKPIVNEYLSWLDIQFDTILDKAKSLLSDNNKLRANQILKDFVKKHENTIIYQERKNEIDAIMALTIQN